MKNFEITRRSEARPIGPIAQALIEKLEKATPAPLRDELAHQQERQHGGASECGTNGDGERVGEVQRHAVNQRG